MSGQDQLSPAEAYAAAKARAKHSVTQEFIDSFDFGFDEFQIFLFDIGECNVLFLGIALFILF